jgi:DNA-binding LytR/AlgR family response regulator
MQNAFKAISWKAYNNIPLKDITHLHKDVIEDTRSRILIDEAGKYLFIENGHAILRGASAKVKRSDVVAACKFAKELHDKIMAEKEFKKHERILIPKDLSALPTVEKTTDQHPSDEDSSGMIMLEMDKVRCIVDYVSQFMKIRKLSFTVSDGFLFIDPDTILRLQAGEGNKTKVFLQDGRSFTGNNNIGEYEKSLFPKFIRVHHSHLINVSHLCKYERDGDDAVVILADTSRVPVSRRKRIALLDFLKQPK